MNKLDKVALHKMYDKIKSFWTTLDVKNATSEIISAINMLSDYEDSSLRYAIYDILFSAVRCDKDFEVACEMLKLLDFKII